MMPTNQPKKIILSAAWGLCISCIILAWFCEELAPDDHLHGPSLQTATVRR